VSVVLQDSVLFEGTIRENIAIGRPDASLEEIIQATIKANIHDTIIELPDGYDTHVREQGNNFSSGQRQRLAIARAILRDTPILMLDEPTANLDVEAEAEVMNALNTLVEGRTVLTISHRLSTLGNVDEILVMENGQIVEQGTFKQLKKLGGVFSHLLEEQNRYNLDRDNDDAIVRSIMAVTTPRMLAISGMTVPRMRSIPSTPTTLSHIPVSAKATLTHRDRLALMETAHIPSIEQYKKTDIPSTSRPRELPAYTKARITILIDDKIVGEHQMNKPILTIGRFPSSDIQINSQRASRFHAVIRWKDESWIMEDAQSLNGLSCEGQRFNQIVLVHGDNIYLDASIVLRYEELE
jgi:ABC-type multidrug transport system ATPase subunit